jgi:GNAT superfamily N-acetyltransferase
MVRPAHKSDRKVVGCLWSDLLRSQAAIDDRFAAADDARERFDNDFFQWLRGDSRRMYVAVDDDGTLCGFVTAERWNTPPIFRECPGVYVDEIFVESGYRRRGHGRALLDAVREWGERIGARELRAGVVAANREGCAFWKNVGGDEIARTFTLTIDGSEEAAPTRGSRIGFRM